jgi:hypothetical protein
MILSDATLTGIIIIVACVLMGIIGVLSDTKKSPGLKWALFFLLLAGAATGINNHYQKDAALKAEKNRAEEALKIAGESNKVVEAGIRKQEEDRQKCIRDQEELEGELKSRQALMADLMGEIVALSVKMEKMEAAADKARKKAIAEMGVDARIATSKALLTLARKEKWLADKELAKMETTIKKKKDPLSPAALKLMQAKIKLKPVGEGTAE